MTRHPSIRLALTATLIVTAVACEPSSSSTSVSAQRPSTDGVLNIVSPKNGETFKTGDVDLVVDLQGARLSTTTTTDLVDNEGHLHVTLDDALISMTSGLEQTLPDVAPGQHLLKVEFVANDHAPFEPRVVAAVAFEVQGP